MAFPRAGTGTKLSGKVRYYPANLHKYIAKLKILSIISSRNDSVNNIEMAKSMLNNVRANPTIMIISLVFAGCVYKRSD